MRPKTRILTLAAVAAVAAGCWFGYRQFVPEAVVSRIARGTAVQAVPANVIVFPESVMDIKAEHGGRVLKRHVKKGQDVKEGDVLFEIDSADLLLDIERIEIDYKATKSRIELGSPLRFDIANAEENVKRNTRLFETGRLAQIEFDQIKRNLEILKDRLANENIANEKELASLENTLKKNRRALEKMKLTAPADGTVVELAPDAEPGSLVGGGQTLARLISKTRRVEAQISEENIAGIRQGLLVAVYLLGYFGERLTGKVDGLLASADERTKRYTAYLDLNIPLERLTPGLTGDASITIDQRENTLVVERRAIMGGKLYLVRDGKVKITPVQMGYNNQKVAEILDGAKEGDLYITDDLAGFRDGQRVRPISASETK